MRISIRSKLFMSHLLAVILVSGSMGTYFYFSAMNTLMTSLKSRLLNSAALVSQAINVQNLGDIRSSEDTATPAYQRVLAQLRQLKQTNPDIAFLYIMRLEDNRVLFVVDSDEGPKQAQPGQAYAQPPPSLLEGFERPSVDDRIYQDAWGWFMSGYAPLSGTADEYLVGLDMRANEVHAKFQTLRASGILSLFLSVLLALFFSRALASHFVAPIKGLIRRCKAIAEGHLHETVPMRAGGELDELVQAFNTMSEELAQSQTAERNATASLQQAKNDLETRVEARTKDLNDTNERLVQEIEVRKKAQEEREATVRELQEALANVKILHGLLPICAHCKKIRDDKGYWRQVEEYIHTHTDARFSHGICPDCEKELYPDHTPS